MSKTVKIPDNMKPWKATINGVEYEYEAGTVQTVPDEVAELITRNEGVTEKFIPEEAPMYEPKGGEAGQYLKKTENGLGWGDLPTLPTEATTETAGLVLQAAAVADAAGSAPTAAEFKALLDALREAGIVAVEAEDDDT